MIGERMTDGGPAFPSEYRERIDGIQYGPPLGMSLRDYFAGQAIMGFLASTRRPTTFSSDDAEWAYQIADALLATRNQERKP